MKGVKSLYLYTFLGLSLLAFFFIYLFIPAELHLLTALLVFIPLFLLAILFQRISNYRVQKIRAQLYQIIQTLEDFDIDEPTAVQFADSPFALFNELNEYLVELINRIRTNFQAHKQFTQNASHELQTPLAIIKGSTEILLQSPNLKQKEMEALGTILQNVNRLSKLNAALILLSKIEHGRFADSAPVNFANIIEDAYKNFKDIIKLQDIATVKYYQAEFIHEMSYTLAETLVNNLFQNAIRYNLPKEGKIHIYLDQNRFIIRNPGKPPLQDPKKMFRRFQRASDIEESLGLGLSIIQSICEQSDLTVAYEFVDELHTLTILKKM